MSVIYCHRCDTRVDTDFHDTERIQVTDDDFIDVCEACFGKHLEAQDAEMAAAYSEYRSAKAEQAERQEIVEAGRGHLLTPYWEKHS